MGILDQDAWLRVYFHYVHRPLVISIKCIQTLKSFVFILYWKVSLKIQQHFAVLTWKHRRIFWKCLWKKYHQYTTYKHTIHILYFILKIFTTHAYIFPYCRYSIILCPHWLCTQYVTFLDIMFQEKWGKVNILLVVSKYNSQERL